jgi:hypothetical protein
MTLRERDARKLAETTSNAAAVAQPFAQLQALLVAPASSRVVALQVIGRQAADAVWSRATDLQTP